MRIKQINVTNVAQNVEFKDYAGANPLYTDFLIQNPSDVNVTFNLDNDAVVGDENCGIVLSKTARIIGEKGKGLSVIAPSNCTIEVQAIETPLVTIDKDYTSRR